MNELLEWASQRMKEAGTNQVWDNTPEFWKTMFEEVALGLLNQHGSFTSEEVVAICGYPPNHPSAIGAATRAVAKKMGLRVSYEASKTPSSHGAIIGRWRV